MRLVGPKSSGARRRRKSDGMPIAKSRRPILFTHNLCELELTINLTRKVTEVMKTIAKKKFISGAALILTLASCGNEHTPQPQVNTGPMTTSAEEAPSSQTPYPPQPGVLSKKPGKTVAKAPEPEKEKKIKRLVECRFSKEFHDKKEKTKHSCIVSGSVCMDAETLGATDLSEHCKNTLVVACNGTILYSDGADYTRMNGFDYLLATTSPHLPIVLMYPTPHLKDCSGVGSWLTIGNHQLEGACDFSQIYEEQRESLEQCEENCPDKDKMKHPHHRTHPNPHPQHLPHPSHHLTNLGVTHLGASQ